MNKNGVTINDAFLIDFLIKDYKKIAFLSETTIDNYIRKIKEIVKSIPNDPSEKEVFKFIFNPSRKVHIDVLDFWEMLIIDSIKYLKWHDLTEFPIKEIHSDKKKEAYSKISEGSLMVYNLKDYFKAFIEFERLLYGAEQFYRDHVYHIIRVWLIGQYIIKTFIKKEKGFLIKIGNGKKLKLANSRLPKSSKNSNTLYEGEEEAIWCLIALTHDLGYPLGKIEEINLNLKKMMSYFAKTRVEEFSFSFPLQNQFINDAILKYISSKIVKQKKAKQITAEPEFNTHIQAKYYLKFSRSFERFDHGLISCIVLAKNLVYFLETNYDHDLVEPLKGNEEARQFVIRREILRAIASHTCKEIYHLMPNSFSFLLLFADEIQFWGRPTSESLTLGIDEHYNVILNRFDKDEVSFKIIFDETRSNDNSKRKSLSRFFIDKASLFKKILRVAVDAKGRSFTLKFIIIDGTGAEYQFIARPWDRAKMFLKLGKAGYKKIEYKELQKIIPVLEKPEQYQEINDLFKSFKDEKVSLHHKKAIK